MIFSQFVSTPFYIGTRDRWFNVNHSTCVLVEDDKETIITACYVELCIYRTDWEKYLCPKEEQGIRVSEKDT